MGIVNSTLGKKKRRLIKEIDILNNSIDNLNILNNENTRKCHELSHARKFLENGMKEQIIKYKNLEIKLKNLNNCATNFECKICMERPIDTINLPCGHTFCGVCIHNVEICFICRKKIDNKIKIFID